MHAENYPRNVNPYFDCASIFVNEPHKNGKECLKIIKSKKSLKIFQLSCCLPVLTNRDKIDCINAGVLVYFVKPNSHDALVKMLRSVGIKPSLN